MLYYITFAHIPTNKAFGYAIARMCSALAEHTPITLVIPGSVKDEEDIFSYYNLPKNFSILRIPAFNFYNYSFLGRRLPFLLRRINFYISLLINLKIKKGDICYSREILTVSLMKLKTSNAFLETHYFSKFDIFLLSLFRSAKKVVAITRYLKDKLVSMGYDEKDILVFPSGTDLKNFTKRNDLPAGRKIVGYIGKYKTMGKGKGVEGLIRIFPDIKSRFTDTFLLLVGIDEDEKKEVESLLSTAGISPNDCKIVEHVRHSEAMEYMASCNLLVMNYPNLPHYANVMSPIKLFEYMASGVPIVTSDLPSVREIINEDEAFFFKADDTHAMLDAVCEALANPEKAGMISKSALEKVKNYSWEKRAEAVIRLINT